MRTHDSSKRRQGQQYQLTLELLGATEEEVDDMRMTLDEARLIYRSELGVWI